MLRERAFWWGISFALLPALAGSVGVAYSGIAAAIQVCEMTLERGCSVTPVVLGGLVYASTVGLLLPCLVFGLSARGLLWRPSDRSAPLLGEASWAVKIGCWLVMQVATLPISLAWALAAAALPWLFLKGGHGS